MKGICIVKMSTEKTEKEYRGELILGEEYEIVYESNNFYDIKDKSNGEIFRYNKKIEEKENKTMKKTFKEVIATIKEGEVWENIFKTISYEFGKIKILNLVDCDNGKLSIFDDTVEYTLQRKEVTFIEAFKAYEEGKEIESCSSEIKYRIIENEDKYFKKGHNNWGGNGVMGIEEIRGKWFINEN